MFQLKFSIQFRLTMIACYSMVLLAGCSAIPVRDETVEFNLRVGVYSYDQQKLTHAKKNQFVTLFFPAISGKIFGRPSQNLIQVASTNTNGELSLVLPNYMGTKAKRFYQSSLSISPNRTRVMRLGTFHLFPEEGDKIGGGGFIDVKTGDSLMLVYFSEPAHLVGREEIGSELFEFNVIARQPGWIWIRSIQLTGEHSKIELYDGSITDIEFAIYLEEVIGV